MSDEQIDRLLALEAAGTPRPWVSVRVHGSLDRAVCAQKGSKTAIFACLENDCDLAAEARNAIADLCRELKAARATLAAVREVTMAAINSSTIHVRGDHSQNCRWCKVRSLLDGKGGG